MIHYQRESTSQPGFNLVFFKKFLVYLVIILVTSYDSNVSKAPTNRSIPSRLTINGGSKRIAFRLHSVNATNILCFLSNKLPIKPQRLQLDGVPVLFKPDFIFHLQSIEQGVRIEVISYLPRVRLGKKFRITGHHEPDFYDDIRRVAPTTQDRKEVLKLIVDLITGSQ